MSDFTILEPEGDAILGERGAMIVLEAAMAGGADVIAIPRERLHPDMLDLSSRQLGLFLQKLVNYHRQVVILGDVSDLIQNSKSFHDFVYESNKGNHVWFLADAAALKDRLA